MLMGTAISATACHQKEEYPSVPEATEPQPTGEIIPTVDRQKELKDARKKYADAVAWLYMPGTEVDDPVVQAKDNVYYLQKDENGNYSEWGCYYAHCDNRLSSRSKLGRNTVIFGHSASNCDPDEPKLTKLHRYMDADYVKENPYVYSSMISSTILSQTISLVRPSWGHEASLYSCRSVPAVSFRAGRSITLGLPNITVPEFFKDSHIAMMKINLL